MAILNEFIIYCYLIGRADIYNSSKEKIEIAVLFMCIYKINYFSISYLLNALSFSNNDISIANSVERERQNCLNFATQTFTDKEKD
jgi:hypothetical protein